MFLARCCYSQKEELRTRTSDNKRSRSHSERFSFAKSLCVSFSARVRFSAACKARTNIFVVFVGEKKLFHTHINTKKKSSLKNEREDFLRSDNEKNRDECYDGINETFHKRQPVHRCCFGHCLTLVYCRETQSRPRFGKNKNILLFVGFFFFDQLETVHARFASCLGRYDSRTVAIRRE